MLSILLFDILSEIVDYLLFVFFKDTGEKLYFFP